MNIRQFKNIVEAMTAEMDGHVIMAFIGNSATQAMYSPLLEIDTRAKNIYMNMVSNPNISEWVIMASHTKERGLSIDFVGKTTPLSPNLINHYYNAKAFTSELMDALNSHVGDASCIGVVFAKAMKLKATTETAHHTADTFRYALAVIESPKTIN